MADSVAAANSKEPWYKHWGAIAAGIFFICLAVGLGASIVLPAIGEGLMKFSYALTQSKTALFTLLLLGAGAAFVGSLFMKEKKEEKKDAKPH